MLPYTKQERKDRPMCSGALNYFPDAIAELARVSKIANEQHNPGEPMHWAREKSKDHGDCILRHQADAGTVDDDNLLHSAKVFWRAGAQLQLELEERHAKGLPPFESPESAVRRGRFSSVLHGEEPRGERPPTLKGIPITFIPPPARMSADGLVGVKPCDKPRVYIAGPMRGLPEFNFPAFDSAKELLLSLGWAVISPADLDRESSTGTAEDDTEASSEERVHEYMQRDLTDTLLTFRASKGDAIAMLPGWEKSTGATTEFMVAKWARLRMLDATTGDALTDFDAGSLARSVAHHLHFANK